jgi:hypothetical protein
MPIRHYLQSHRFDAETARLLGVAFEMALVALQHADALADPTRDAVAQKIIELAKAGERDPDRLCDEALKATLPTAPVNHRPRSSSASRFTVGAAGFLNFNQSGERPRPVTRSRALRDNPFQTHLAGVLEDRQAAVVL